MAINLEKTGANKIVTIFLVLLFTALIGYFSFSKNQRSAPGGKGKTTASFKDMGQPLGEDIINCEFYVDVS